MVGLTADLKSLVCTLKCIYDIFATSNFHDTRNLLTVSIFVGSELG